MTSRPERCGRSKIGRQLLAAGLTLSMGYAFGVFTLGGCGGSPAGFAGPANGQLPERVVEELTDCSRRGPAALQPVKHTVSFDVFMNPDGQVEQVALRDSTLHTDEVEACMADALHALSRRAMDASLRRREPAAPASLSPETHTLFANPIVLGAGVVEVGLVIGFLYITVVVYYQVVHNTKTHRPPPPTVVEDPPKPEPPKPETQTQGDPKTTDPPPPPPPLPPKENETCEEKHPKLVRCDDPTISSYQFWSENAAFNEIVKRLGKGVRKSAAHERAQRGPCAGRGGFHTNVLGGGDSAATIVGCDCCDDASGKALQKQRAGIIYKR